MLKWRDILRLANDGNLAPDKRVEKTPEQWQMLLDDDVYYITRNKGTERPFISGSCTLFEPGKYACVC